MPDGDTYIARSGKAAVEGATTGISHYTIVIRFLGGLTQPQKDAFKAAANRWTKVILGDLPSVTVNGELIDDILITAQGAQIDGSGGILGQAGPTRIRPRTAGAAAYLPATGQMMFDIADLARMEAGGTLNDVITHEMGHVIGLGTVWPYKGLLSGSTTTNPTFTGPAAEKEYGLLRGSGPFPVPVENQGGPGTRNGHWRESVFANELMTGYINRLGNPLSRVTVASMQDLGYQVALSAAEAYSLPNHLEMAERGMPRMVGDNLGMVLPIIPIELPIDSLVPATKPRATTNPRAVSRKKPT